MDHNRDQREVRRTAVVTGGAQGIGRIVADALREAGYRVAVWDHDAEAVAEESVRHTGEEGYLALGCDVSSEESIGLAVAETVRQMERIDLLVNNAAIHANKPMADLDPGEWRHVIGVNLTGPFLCTRACETELRRHRGAVVNMCSTRAFQSEPHTEAYSASKGGVLALTHALAISLGPEVRVNCISPGWIDVSAVRKKSAARQEELHDRDHAQHPAGRVGTPLDIARMVLFLADPQNGFITGQNFIVDGGMTRKMIYL